MFASIFIRTLKKTPKLKRLSKGSTFYTCHFHDVTEARFGFWKFDCPHRFASLFSCAFPYVCLRVWSCLLQMSHQRLLTCSSHRAISANEDQRLFRKHSCGMWAHEENAQFHIMFRGWPLLQELGYRGPFTAERRGRVGEQLRSL